MKCSIYKNSFDADTNLQVDMFTFLTSDKYKDRVLSYRDKYRDYKAKKANGEQVTKPKKDGIPMITPSGVFSYRSLDNLVHFNKCICIDIDGIENPEEIKDMLREYANIWFCGLSTSGEGLFAIVKIDCEQDRFLDAFYKLQEWFRDSFKIEVDMARKDIVGARYASYDPNYHYNPDATEMSVPKHYSDKKPTTTMVIEGDLKDIVARWENFVDMYAHDFVDGQGWKWLTHKTFIALESGIPEDIVVKKITTLARNQQDESWIKYHIGKIYRR